LRQSQISKVDSEHEELEEKFQKKMKEREDTENRFEKDIDRIRNRGFILINFENSKK
jgi:hypothetical protein